MAKRFYSLMIPEDQGGCAFYRIVSPKLSMMANHRNVISSESFTPITNVTYYQHVRMIKIQRQCTAHQFNFAKSVLKVVNDTFGSWLIYDIDDVLVHVDMPDYNLAKPQYNAERTKYLGDIMKLADFVTVSTDILGEYYQNLFRMSRDKFITVPNYVPKWWIGNSYDIDRIEARYNNMKKPKIAFVCGSNHFDLKNLNNGIDDFTHIIDWIRSNVKNYDFHFVGGLPLQLKDLLKGGKIFKDPPCDIYNYPREIANRGYDLWVAPLQDNIFNRCKSNIKLVESWALGIPSIVQECACYSKYTDNRFITANDLQKKIDYILKSKKNYLETVKHGRDIVEHGDSNAKNGYFLEDNLDIHKKLFMLNQKTMKIKINQNNGWR